MPFLQNDELTYEHNKYYEQNTFLGAAAKRAEIPVYENIKNELPRPIFDGHEDYIACYDFAQNIAFSNIKPPKPGSGFVGNFLDNAFNGHLFMWDSAFMLMFAKYAARIFPAQSTLDNFYAHQHKDGFICREIDEATGRDIFTRHDPSSTGPNVLPFCEWDYFENFGDAERLKQVYAPLRAYHLWLYRNRRWRDGSYFSTGWGCGMDNIPRQREGDVHFSNGRMVWIDACLQQILSCDILIAMNEILKTDDVSDLAEERENLIRLVNEKMWDENTKFYYDLWENDEKNMVKHIGAYWALLAGVVPKERLDGFVAHLENEREFNRKNAVPALSCDHPGYRDDGGYWCGGVWAPTNYMVLKGLSKNGYDTLAYKIADKYLKNVVEVFNKTGTLWENYSPENVSPGSPSNPDFVGWTGLAPISVFFEYVIGIKPDAKENTIVWNVNKLERHGIENYPFSTHHTMDLICEKRKTQDEEPRVTVRSNKPVRVIVKWGDREKEIG